MAEALTKRPGDRSGSVHPLLQHGNPDMDLETRILTEPALHKAFEDHLNSDPEASGESFLQLLQAYKSPLVARQTIPTQTAITPSREPSPQPVAITHSIPHTEERITNSTRRATISTPSTHAVIWILKKRRLPNGSLGRLRSMWRHISSPQNNNLGIQALQIKPFVKDRSSKYS